jgi:hypothetical protein
MCLSAARFAVMAATTAQGQYLFHVVPEKKPYFPGERHFDMKVR